LIADTHAPTHTHTHTHTHVLHSRAYAKAASRTCSYIAQARAGRLRVCRSVQAEGEVKCRLATRRL
jgi:hypothetical protein